jgi:hypothetical protein
MEFQELKWRPLMYKFPVREEERERESDMSRGKITASVFLRV